jgi:apolipoprotein N-acyltransferase
VPFAEFIPLAATFPRLRGWVRELSGLTIPDMRPGSGFPLWEVAGARFGLQICFEGIFPEISREIARKGADFTVNISNDGWFRDSAELDQMLVMARFRAVESRIGFIRATNTGISAFIEPSGRLGAVLEAGGRRKEVKGMLTARVKVTGASSLYRALGDWACWAALGALAAELVRRFFIDMKKRAA